MRNRSVSEIKLDLKALELESELIFIKKQKLHEELFKAEYFKVQWDNAEEMFINLLSTDDNWSGGPVAIHDASRFYSSTNISIEELKDGSKQMWMGGYEHKDGFRRGEPFYIERKYENEYNTFRK